MGSVLPTLRSYTSRPFKKSSNDLIAEVIVVAYSAR